MNAASRQSCMRGFRRFLLLLIAAFSSCAAGDPLADFEMTVPGQRLPAPVFELADLSAGTVSLDRYRGKVLLLHFWATFCGPCRREMPQLQALWRQYRERGLVVLGIAADRGSVSVIREFVHDSGITFPVLQDRDGTVRNRYEVVVLPTTYLVGRDGRITGRAPGSRDWGSRQGHTLIESLLGDPGGS
jgi:peroxiredoxin